MTEPSDQRPPRAPSREPRPGADGAFESMQRQLERVGDQLDRVGAEMEAHLDDLPDELNGLDGLAERTHGRRGRPHATSTAGRLALAIPAVAAVAAILAVIPVRESVRAAGLPLLPLVFLATVGLDWLDELALRHDWIDRVFGKVFDLWDSSGTGFYGIMAVVTFLRLEADTVTQEVGEAGSLQGFVVGQLLDFGIDTILNLVHAGIWFVDWFGRFHFHELAILGGAAYGVYALGRWSWVERPVAVEPPGEREGEEV